MNRGPKYVQNVLANRNWALQACIDSLQHLCFLDPEWALQQCNSGGPELVDMPLQVLLLPDGGPYQGPAGPVFP